MNSDLIRPEVAHSINGVPGRLFALRVPPAPWKAGTFANQKWVSESREVKGYGPGATLTVEARFDDNCKNGRNDFAITAHVETPASRRRNDWEACGCLHDDIAQVFPELAHLIKWHLCATDGPMHYLANTVYLAGDRDYNGRRKGEPSAWDDVVRFGTSPVLHKPGAKFAKFLQSRIGTGDFQVVAMAHDNKPGGYQFTPKFTFAGYGEKWHECPFDDAATAQAWAQALNDPAIGAHFDRIPTAYSEGKARELEAARRAAIWPEATDKQLTSEPDQLRDMLTSRLPALIAEFRATMESIGFVWEAPARSEG